MRTDPDHEEEFEGQDALEHLSNTPLSRDILIHNEYMSMRLRRLFGDVHATAKSQRHVGDRLLRESALIQTASGQKILDARLEIRAAELPATVLEALQGSSELFGLLLMEEGISVRFQGVRIYRSGPRGETGAIRWGRRLQMTSVETGRTLCDVDELLNQEDILKGLVRGN